MESSAIFGFAGVLVGAGGAYLSQRGAERRRDRSDTRVALRLVLKDLMSAMARLIFALNHKTWWTVVEEELSVENWTQHEEVLARHLPLDDWTAIRNAFQVIENLDDLSKWRISQGKGHGVDDDAVKQLEEELDYLGDVMLQMVVLSERRLPPRERFVAWTRRLRRRRASRGKDRKASLMAEIMPGDEG